MAKSENRKYYTAIVVAALIACAVVLRVLGKFDILRVPGGIARFPLVKNITLVDYSTLPINR